MIANVILHFSLFFFLSKQYLLKWSWFNKERREKRGKGFTNSMLKVKKRSLEKKRGLCMEKGYLQKKNSLWSYEFPNVLLLCLWFVYKCSWWCCHLTILYVVQSSNNDVFQMSFFTNYSLPSLPCCIFVFLWLFCNSFHFAHAKQGL